MYVELDKYVDFFLEKDRTTLLELLQEDDLKEEIIEYMTYEIQVCPCCFGDLKTVKNEQKSYNVSTIEYKCQCCGYKDDYR